MNVKFENFVCVDVCLSNVQCSFHVLPRTYLTHMSHMMLVINVCLKSRINTNDEGS